MSRLATATPSARAGRPHILSAKDEQTRPKVAYGHAGAWASTRVARELTAPVERE
jgi:hypothetical protein